MDSVYIMHQRYKYQSSPSILLNPFTRTTLKSLYFALKIKAKMHFTNILALLAAPIIVAATLDPATSNTKGYKPKSLNCSGTYTYPIPPNSPPIHPILTPSLPLRSIKSLNSNPSRRMLAQHPRLRNPNLRRLRNRPPIRLVQRRSLRNLQRVHLHRADILRARG